MNNPARIAVEKAMEQLDFIAQSFNLNLFQPTSRGDMVDDLVVMLEHGDLEHVILQLLDAQSTIRFEFRIEFAADGHRKDLRDSAAGVEVPVLPSGLITGLRLLVSRHKRMDQYRHLLKNANWQPAPSLRKDAGDLMSRNTFAVLPAGGNTAKCSSMPQPDTGSWSPRPMRPTRSAAT